MLAFHYSQWPRAIRYPALEHLHTVFTLFAVVAGGFLSLFSVSSVYADEPVRFDPTPVIFSADSDNTSSIAWGDVDGDGDLDLAVGNRHSQHPNRVYENKDGVLQNTPIWTSNNEISDLTTSIAWGDIDGDGDIDLAVGNDGSPNRLYINQNGKLSPSVSWSATSRYSTQSIALGDIDGDGRFDLVVGNKDAPNQIYFFTMQNEKIVTSHIWSEPAGTNDKTYGAVLGDIDRDHDLDLVFGSSNISKVYQNTKGTLGLAFDLPGMRQVALIDMNNDSSLELATDKMIYYFKVENDKLQIAEDKPMPPIDGSVAWGDIDNDGDFDLVTYSVSDRLVKIAQNINIEDNLSNLQSISDKGPDGTSLALGDVDGDGDLDIVLGVTSNAPNRLYINASVKFQTSAHWKSAAADPTKSVAWGDIDRNGYLDLVVGNSQGNQSHYNNKIYYNDEGHIDTIGKSFSPDTDDTSSVALGDVNGDGYLDIAVGNGKRLCGNDQVNKVYIYDPTTGSFPQPRELNKDSPDCTKSVVFGDVDNDGDLDLVVGNGDHNAPQQSRLYWNDSQGNFTFADQWQPKPHRTFDVALGDMDSDGDLDLAVANEHEPSQIYLNTNGIFANEPVWTSINDDTSGSAAWGDVDNDGDLDLAVRNWIGPNRLFLNQAGMLEPAASWFSADNDFTLNAIWGDIDGDGDLDLVAGAKEDPDRIYINQNGSLNRVGVPLRPASAQSIISLGVALGDIDNDGDLDLAVGNECTTSCTTPEDLVYRNRGPGGYRTPTGAFPLISVTRPVTTANADFYSTPIILSERFITITYSLFDDEQDPVGQIKAYYSVDGGGKWLPAFAATNTVTTTLSTTPFPTKTVTNTHTYVWDTFASNFFGQSDNVVFRIEAYPQPPHGAITDTYRYTNSVPGPFMWSYASATTFPFRVRGTQVRVYRNAINEENALRDALVYRLPAGTATIAAALTNLRGVPFVTDQHGFLQGRGELTKDDRLVALWPVTNTAELITFTNRISLYHTSAAPTPTGLALTTVSTPGVQSLVVSDSNKLLLFHLDVSLEWDARNDPAYLSRLEQDILRASELLYDLTNGQAAFGDVRIYQNKERWGYADLVIYASNSVRPNATLGGIVSKRLIEAVTLPTDQGATQQITYWPGQIRLGATWNRFGQNTGEIGEDWARVLVHEFGHYAFFLLDNYLGIASVSGAPNSKVLVRTDCKPSVMTNSYVDAYSEFAGLTEWKRSATCKKTVAENVLGRADWETIEKFYPLEGHDTEQAAEGPAHLPLAITQVQFINASGEPNTLAQFLALDEQSTALSAPFFSIEDSEGETEEFTSERSVQGYLFKVGATTVYTDDYIVEVGTPNRDFILARGAQPGDNLCLFDSGREPMRSGCITVGATASELTMQSIPNWEPVITISPITITAVPVEGTVLTDSLVIDGEKYQRRERVQDAMIVTVIGVTVTNVSSVTNLHLQLYPTLTRAEPPVLLVSTDSHGIFTTVITVPFPTFSGLVHLWVAETNNKIPQRQAVVKFHLGAGWVGDRIAWDGDRVAWDGDRVAWDGDRVAWHGDRVAWDGDRIAWHGDRVAWDGDRIAWNAPISSPDGQVIFMDLDNILTASNANYMLQENKLPPSLPSWLTPVGAAYHFMTQAEMPPNMSVTFNYLQRHVPEGQERDLAVYYLPKEENSVEWQRLETAVIDAELNIASAQAPGPGVYALLSTVEMPPFHQGWNNFGYPIPYTRPITTALASITGFYTTVYRYESTTASPWKLYDQRAVEDHPELAGFVNDLTQLEFGQGYWLYATEPITLYLAGPESQVQAPPPIFNVTPVHTQLPPAIYYGWVNFEDSTMEKNWGGKDVDIVARVGDTECGRTSITKWKDKFAYKLTIPSASSGLCQTQPFSLAVDNRTVTESVWWDNTQANYLELSIKP